jgi:hypothetical protein
MTRNVVPSSDEPAEGHVPDSVGEGPADGALSEGTYSNRTRPWLVTHPWAAPVVVCVLIAGVDALLGPRVILIGLLAAGPCWALLTGRWRQTGLVGVVAVGLAVVLGVPDRIWGTGTQIAFIAAVAVVGAAATFAAVVMERSRALR